MADYGTDLAVVDDLPARDAFVSGRLNVGYALARRLQTPRGALAAIGDDADYGLDVRQLVGAGLTDRQRAEWEAAIAAECRKDDRVDSATVTLTSDLSTQTLTIDIAVMLVDDNESFSFVLTVDQLTVAFLSEAA
jgi:hypothetical protein